MFIAIKCKLQLTINIPYSCLFTGCSKMIPELDLAKLHSPPCAWGFEMLLLISGHHSLMGHWAELLWDCWSSHSARTIGPSSLPSPRIHQMKIDGRVMCNLGKMLLKTYNLNPFCEFSFSFFIFNPFLKYYLITSFYISFEGGRREALCAHPESYQKIFARIPVNTLVVNRTIKQQICS